MIDHAVLGNLFAWACQVVLIVVVASLMLPLLRIDAPSLRYAWWRLVLAACLLLPIVQPWRVVEIGTTSALVLSTGEFAIGATPASGQSTTAGPDLSTRRARPVSWPAGIAIALVAGAVLRLAWLGAGLLRLRSLRKAGERAAPCDGHEELAKLIEAGAEIRYVRVIGQPVTFGVRRPVVLLPDTLRSLPENVQRAILAHELWHVQRRDWIWILAEEIVRALLWFHPAISFVVSRVQYAREEVVDELTVLLTNSRRSYLEALLAFADKPALFAAAPFARRRHLFQRMLLISREGVMSSRRIVMSGAAMAIVLLGTISVGAASFPFTAQATFSSGNISDAATPQPVVPSARPRLDRVTPATEKAQAPPRDPRQLPPPPPPPPMVAGTSEAELQKAIAAAPGASVTLYYELSKLQERRGATAEAEATLQAGRRAFPKHDGMLRQLTQFYLRTDSFEKAISVLEDAAAADPSNPQGHHVVATFYEEKLRKSHDLSPTEKLTYIQAGIAAEDRALTYDPEYVDALVYKNILLRYQANLETASARRQQLLAEADALRNRALELRKGHAATQATKAQIGHGTSVTIDGQAPVRVGGNIKPPTKIRDVRPAYPPDAMSARVQGVVILEAVIDGSGRVREAKVLRSIPMLDQAAVDAVTQWEFTPTLLNGVPVPVIMTVTVNFTLQ